MGNQEGIWNDYNATNEGVFGKGGGERGGWVARRVFGVSIVCVHISVDIGMYRHTSVPGGYLE
jgi:hypothetical protein